jgi:hypothetical protein
MIVLSQSPTVSQLRLALLLYVNGWLRVRVKAEHYTSKEKDEPFARPIQLFWEE